MNNTQLSKRIDHQIKRFGRQVGIKQFKTQLIEKNQFDEILEKEYRRQIIFVRGLIYFDPTEELLNEAGMGKDEVDIIARVALLELKRKGLYTDEIQFGQDDILVIDDVDYDIKKVRHHVHYVQHHIISIGAIKA